MSYGAAPKCLWCIHYNDADEDSLSCKAFPDGIPAEIIDGYIEHIEPYEGDNGFIFTPGRDPIKAASKKRKP